MSQIFTESESFRSRFSFEDRLKLAFRGDAGEQRKASKKFFKGRGGSILPITLGSTIQRATGVNIFKSNLGGTNR